MTKPDTTRTVTEAEFEALSWHDNHIHGIQFRRGDPDAGDWSSDLLLDIDHITEWVQVDGEFRFRIAPATLVFHGVTDPRIDIDWGDSGLRVAHPPPSVDRIERAPVADQQIYLDRPYYRWQIHLNSPSNGNIALGAYGFTQTLRCEPVLCEEQMLGSVRRRELAPLEPQS